MTRMERRKRRQRQIRRRIALALMAVIFVVTVLTAVADGSDDERDTAMQATPMEEAEPKAVPEPAELASEVEEPELETTGERIEEDPNETEEIERALLEKGYLHEEIPLDYDLQCHLIAVCGEYGVPYHIALGVIQAESSFRSWVSNGTCFGYMQIHKVNAEWLREQIGVTDLMDPYQNLRSGVYILKDLYGRFGDWSMTLIAYNYGAAGAEKHVFSKGYTTTAYSRAVMAYADAWLEVVGA